MKGFDWLVLGHVPDPGPFTVAVRIDTSYWIHLGYVPHPTTTARKAQVCAGQVSRIRGKEGLQDKGKKNQPLERLTSGCASDKRLLRTYYVP